MGFCTGHFSCFLGNPLLSCRRICLLYSGQVNLHYQSVIAAFLSLNNYEKRHAVAELPSIEMPVLWHTIMSFYCFTDFKLLVVSWVLGELTITKRIFLIEYLIPKRFTTKELIFLLRIVMHNSLWKRIVFLIISAVNKLSITI